MKHLLLTIAALVLEGCGIHNDALIQAIKEGNIEAVKQHTSGILRGDVNAKDKLGVTPLFYAAFKGYKEIAKLLIAEGADVNTKNYYLLTPLHDAADEGRNEIVELLIAEGADVNAKSKGGVTPLDSAVYYGQKETANLLRKHGGKTTGNLIPNTSGVQSLF